MTIKIYCECGQPIEIKTEQTGQPFNCPSCGKEFIISDKKETQKIIMTLIKNKRDQNV